MYEATWQTEVRHCGASVDCERLLEQEGPDGPNLKVCPLFVKEGIVAQGGVFQAALASGQAKQTARSNSTISGLTSHEV